MEHIEKETIEVKPQGDPADHATEWATYLEALRKGLINHARFWGVESECERDTTFMKCVRRLDVEEDFHVHTPQAAFSAFHLGMRRVQYRVELERQ
jgi:hypothetical protein